MNSRPRTVYFLGAGFSRALGGPLFDELFAPTTLQPLAKALATWRATASEAQQLEALHVAFYPAIFTIFRDGLRGSVASQRNAEGLWGNAEQFLIYLEERDLKTTLEALYGNTSPRPKDVTEVFDMRTDPALKDKLQAAARDIVAFECHDFLHRAPDREVWETYVDWAETLGGESHIISFNYDLTFERIRCGANEPGPKQAKSLRVHSPLPRTPSAPVRTEQPLLYKLHGSVNWFTDVDALTQKTAHHETSPWVERDDEQCEVRWAPAPTHVKRLMGMPGAAKASMYDVQEMAWESAISETKHATRVVFLGYRFPESDARSLSEFLGAINSGGGATECLVVLGPPSRESQRLCSLLTYALSKDPSKPCPQVRDTGLYVEDYLLIEGMEQDRRDWDGSIKSV